MLVACGDGTLTQPPLYMSAGTWFSITYSNYTGKELESPERLDAIIRLLSSSSSNDGGISYLIDAYVSDDNNIREQNLAWADDIAFVTTFPTATESAILSKRDLPITTYTLTFDGEKFVFPAGMLTEEMVGGAQPHQQHVVDADSTVTLPMPGQLVDTISMSLWIRDEEADTTKFYGRRRFIDAGSITVDSSLVKATLDVDSIVGETVHIYIGRSYVHEVEVNGRTVVIIQRINRSFEIVWE